MSLNLFHSSLMLTGSWMGRTKTGRGKRMKKKNIMMYTEGSSKSKTICVPTWLRSVLLRY